MADKDKMAKYRTEIQQVRRPEIDEAKITPCFFTLLQKSLSGAADRPLAFLGILFHRLVTLLSPSLPTEIPTRHPSSQAQKHYLLTLTHSQKHTPCFSPRFFVVIPRFMLSLRFPFYQKPLTSSLPLQRPSHPTSPALGIKALSLSTHSHTQSPIYLPAAWFSTPFHTPNTLQIWQTTPLPTPRHSRQAS